MARGSDPGGAVPAGMVCIVDVRLGIVAGRDRRWLGAVARGVLYRLVRDA